MSKKPQSKIDANRLEPNSEQKLEEQLSEGFFYMCKVHESRLRSQIPIVSAFNAVPFKKYYFHYGAKLKELRRDFNGYASIIIIINSYCCQSAFLATREINWKIYYNKTLKKVAKVIINGFVYGHKLSDHISNPSVEKYVMTSGKSFQPQPSIAKLERNRKEVPLTENTIAICGRGYPNLEDQVSYDENLTLRASHPIEVIVRALDYELKKFLKEKTIREITDICIRKIKSNSEFKVDLECEVLGIAGMFLHHISPTVGLIINHYTFPDEIGIRTGSAHDVFAVSNFFRALKITHYIIEDGNVDKVRTAMEWVKTTDFSEFERIMIVVMSHGGPDGAIYANDGEYNLFTDVLDELLKNKTLKNVDKYIYVNKCRGTEETEIKDQKKTNKRLLNSIGKQLEESKEQTKDKNDGPEKLTIVHSCSEGNVSKIFDYEGSPLIQSLINTLEQNDGLIDMKRAIQKVIDTVYNDMDEMDFYQQPEFVTTCEGDIIWNVETIINLYVFKYDQLKVGNTYLSTRPYIGLERAFGDSTLNSCTNEEYWQDGDRKENILEKYAFYVLLRDKANIHGGGAISAENSMRIQQLLVSLVCQTWIEKRENLNYAIIDIRSKYMVVNCCDQVSMTSINQIKYNRKLPGVEIEIIPLLKKSHVLTLSAPAKRFKTLEDCKKIIASENPQLQSHMWGWQPLPNSRKTVCVQLSLLDMERLEQNNMDISYLGEKMRITKQHKIFEKQLH